MTIEQLKELLQSDIAKAQEAIKKAKGDKKTEDYLKQYDVAEHDVMKTDKRPDKPIENDKGQIDRYEAVARLAIPYQKLITQTSAAFLCANPIHLDATPKDDAQEKLLAGVQKVHEDNKLDFKSMDLAEKMMSETEVAELWYTEPLGEEEKEYWIEEGINGSQRLRVKILAKSLGDDLYPYWDNTGDMIAFGRGFRMVDEAGKALECFDVYTAEAIYYFIKGEGGWQPREQVGHDGTARAVEPNIVGKIPVIYYTQEAPEWSDIQTLIDRLETKYSNHADTNDYFDSPTFFFEGEVISMPEKGKNGKAIQLGEGGKAGYLTWNEAPASTKLEIDNLRREILACTSTPDISFENLKGLGTTSGFALEMMFMGAHLKAARKAGIFGESVQRRINYLKAAVSTIDTSLKKAASVSIKPQFEFFMPKDLQGLVDMLTTAVTGGIMSKRSAVSRLQLVEDVEEELKTIQDEKNSAGALNEEMS